MNPVSAPITPASPTPQMEIDASFGGVTIKEFFPATRSLVFMGGFAMGSLFTLLLIHRLRQ